MKKHLSKFFLITCLFILCACGSNEKEEEVKVEEKKLEDFIVLNVDNDLVSITIDGEVSNKFLEELDKSKSAKGDNIFFRMYFYDDNDAILGYFSYEYGYKLFDISGYYDYSSEEFYNSRNSLVYFEIINDKLVFTTNMEDVNFDIDKIVNTELIISNDNKDLADTYISYEDIEKTNNPILLPTVYLPNSVVVELIKPTDDNKYIDIEVLEYDAIPTSFLDELDFFYNNGLIYETIFKIRNNETNEIREMSFFKGDSNDTNYRLSKDEEIVEYQVSMYTKDSKLDVENYFNSLQGQDFKENDGLAQYVSDTNADRTYYYSVDTIKDNINYSDLDEYVSHQDYSTKIMFGVLLK